MQSVSINRVHSGVFVDPDTPEQVMIALKKSLAINWIVMKMRNVAHYGRPVTEQGRRKNRQSSVLRAGNAHIAFQRNATCDDEFVH